MAEDRNKTSSRPRLLMEEGEGVAKGIRSSWVGKKLSLAHSPALPFKSQADRNLSCFSQDPWKRAAVHPCPHRHFWPWGRSPQVQSDPATTIEVTPTCSLAPSMKEQLLTDLNKTAIAHPSLFPVCKESINNLILVPLLLLTHHSVWKCHFTLPECPKHVLNLAGTSISSRVWGKINTEIRPESSTRSPAVPAD